MKANYKKFLLMLALLWGGAFMALSGTHLFLMLPQQKEADLLGKQLEEKRLRYDLSKAADSEQARIQLSEKVNELTEELDTFAAKVDDLDSLWFSVSRIASEIGVDSFQSRGKDNESYSLIPNCYNIGIASMEVDFIGSFTKFAKFINRLERYKPIVFIDGFTIIRPTQEDSVPKSKLFLSVFVRVPAKDRLTEETPGAPTSVIDRIF
jgi:hypothetical protein